jgi:hypothetical protein
VSLELRNDRPNLIVYVDRDASVALSLDPKTQRGGDSANWAGSTRWNTVRDDCCTCETFSSTIPACQHL